MYSQVQLMKKGRLREERLLRIRYRILLLFRPSSLSHGILRKYSMPSSAEVCLLR